MKTVMELTEGDRVCVKGQGMDATVHFHTAVKRVTKTMIITTSGRRYRREVLGPSIPYAAYGGTSISPVCQVKS